MSSDQPPEHPRSGPGPQAVAREAERKRRLASALRENLRKRKAPPPAKPAVEPDEA